MKKALVFWISVLFMAQPLKASEAVVGFSLWRSPLTLTSMTFEKSYSFFLQAKAMCGHFWDKLKSFDITPYAMSFADSQTYPQKVFVSSLSSPLKDSVLDKAPSTRLLEFGLSVPLDSKIEWGAGIAVEKYKTGFMNDTSPKRPSVGLRLKPDLYTLQIGLKYKI